MQDIYPLTKVSGASDVWSAVQYHDPETDSGVVLVFRRETSAYTEGVFSLFGLDCGKKYRFTESNGETIVLDGGKLTEEGFSVRIAKKRDSRVYFYNAEQ